MSTFNCMQTTVTIQHSPAVIVSTQASKTRDQVRDLHGNYPRPRPRPWPFSLETKTETFEKWTRVHSSHETLVSTLEITTLDTVSVYCLFQIIYIYYKNRTRGTKKKRIKTTQKKNTRSKQHLKRLLHLLSLVKMKMKQGLEVDMKLNEPFKLCQILKFHIQLKLYVCAFDHPDRHVSFWTF